MIIDLSHYQLHVFDLDDTLINTRHAYGIAQEQAIRDVFSQTPGVELTPAINDLRWLCKQFGSGNVRDYMSAFIQSRPDLFTFNEQILDQVVTRYYRIFYTELKCFEGVFAYINQLKNQNKTIALVSNGIVSSQLEKLQKTNLQPLFHETLCFVSGSYPPNLKKPSPHMVKQALQKANVTAEKGVFYGNMLSDTVAGNLAGILTVFYSGSTPIPDSVPMIAKPDYTFESWLDLVVQT